MGSIVGAALVSHVPTIVLPEAVRRELNDGDDTSLHGGLHELAAARLRPLEPDTIVVIDTHWFTTIEFVVAAHDRRQGIYTSEELPRGMSRVPYDMPGDRALAEAWAGQADDRDDMWITAIDDDHLPVHYPTINLLPFLQGTESWVSASICQTAEPDDFLRFGQLLAEAVAGLDRRVVVLASGGLSHRFWPLQQFRDHEAADPRNPPPHPRGTGRRPTGPRLARGRRPRRGDRLRPDLPSARPRRPLRPLPHHDRRARRCRLPCPRDPLRRVRGRGRHRPGHVWFDQ